MRAAWSEDLAVAMARRGGILNQLDVDCFNDPAVAGDANEGFEGMAADGVELESIKVGSVNEHPAHATCGERYSAYSDDFHLLLREDWSYIDLDVRAQPCTQWVLASDVGARPMMHGTEWGSAVRMIAFSQGFVPGVGTHCKNRKTYGGAWCVPTIGDAIQRSDPSRYKDGEGSFNRFCCPVVLEIRCASLVRMGARSTMHCCQAPRGERHFGMAITRVHFNTKFMANYLAFETDLYKQKQRMLAGDPWSSWIRICHCGICGAMCWPGHPDYDAWEKSGGAHWYVARCLRRKTAHVRVVF